MNSEQYKEWHQRHAKTLYKIKTSDYYEEFIDRLWNEIRPPGSHIWEMWLDSFDEFILEVLGNTNDRCNKETGYHSNPHIGCIMR